MSNLTIGTSIYNNPFAGGYGSGVQPFSSQLSKAVVNPGESTEVSPGRKSSPAQCETCKNRKYQDGSDEMVSFKSASHISPKASASKVRAHEQEHVSNAYTKAAKAGGKVLSASVTLKPLSALNVAPAMYPAAPPLPGSSTLMRAIPMSRTKRLWMPHP